MPTVAVLPSIFIHSWSLVYLSSCGMFIPGYFKGGKIHKKLIAYPQGILLLQTGRFIVFLLYFSKRTCRDELLRQVKAYAYTEPSSCAREGTCDERAVDGPFKLPLYVKFLVERICNAGPQLEVYVTVRYRAQVANFALQGSGIGHGEVKTECEVILEHNGAPLRFERQSHVVLRVTQFKGNILAVHFRDLRIGNVERQVALGAVLKIAGQPALGADIDPDQRRKLLRNEHLVDYVHRHSFAILVDSKISPVVVFDGDVQTKVIGIAILKRVRIVDNGIRRRISMGDRHHLENF